jgi:hypothetical protein
MMRPAIRKEIVRLGKLGYPPRDLAHRYDVPSSTVTRVFAAARRGGVAIPFHRIVSGGRRPPPIKIVLPVWLVERLQPAAAVRGTRLTPFVIRLLRHAAQNARIDALMNDGITTPAGEADA